MADAPRDPPISNPPIRLAVCVSGGGTTLQNLIDRIKSKKLRAEIVQVIASKPRIGAIPKAEAAGIPLALANRAAKSLSDFSRSIFDPIRHSRADLVILGGFLSLVEIPSDYVGKVINIHPALAGVQRQRISRLGRSQGSDRVGREGERLHGSLRGREL